jgi:membrane-bound metal-dependent hydrolase YbcI (DUF457 family)
LPLTPFHYPVAYLIYKLGSKLKLSLPGLIVGSMFPDLEIPFMILLQGTGGSDRLVLHSLLGAATIGTSLSVLFTVFMFPPLIGSLLRIDKDELRSKCSFSLVLILSVFLGNISHVLLDITNHSYNPILWPFVMIGDTPSLICSALGGMVPASLVIHTLMTLLFVALFINKRENLLKRILVE